MSRDRIQPAVSRTGKLAFAGVALLVLGAPIFAEASAWLLPDTAPVPGALQAEVLDQPAPDFVLRDLEGRPVRLSDFRGKTVFLNFWATWCPPCVEELPSMMRLAGTLRDRDFVILAVSEDESAEDVLTFFESGLPPFPVVMDEDQRVTRAYGTFKFPETYVIGPEGRIRARFVGPRAWDGPASLRYFDALTR